MDDLLSDFLTETTESLGEADVALVRLERTPDDAATLSLVFRLVHTIKGTCGFLGLPRLERVAHAAENVLGKVRDGALTVTPDVVTQVLAALDRIKLIVAGLAATEAEPAGDDSALIAALDRVASGQATAPAPAAATPVAPSRSAGRQSLARRHRRPPPSSPMRRGRSRQRRSIEEAPSASVAAAPAPAAAAAPADAAATDKTVAQQTIRVTVDVLEDLMTLVSELVLTRNQLLQTCPHAEEQHLRGAAAAAVAHHVRAAGRRHEDAHAADRQCVEQAAAHRPRSGPRHGQEDRAGDARGGDRAGPPGAGADQGSADAHGAQLRRPRAGDAGRAPRRRQAGDRAYHAERLPRGRSHHHRDRRRRPRAGDRSDPRQGAGQRPGLRGRTGGDDRGADPSLHLPRRVLHRRDGHRGVRPRRRHGRGEARISSASAARST